MILLALGGTCQPAERCVGNTHKHNQNNKSDQLRLLSIRQPKSKFHWYDFTARGQRYRGSTRETKAARAAKVAGLKLGRAVEGTDPLPNRAALLVEFSRRFLDWLDDVKLEDKTKAYYRDGWRLLKTTIIADTGCDQITSESVERLNFSGSPSNTNGALRSLRRMLHKAEEWKLIPYSQNIHLG